MHETPKPAEPPRALALDALRGLAILMMCLSGVVPEGLPNWMYHGYYPRFMPDADGVWQMVADPHTFRAGWSSFMWTDWVFPMFLFAMGAAFPLALGRRLDKGASAWRVALAVLGRGAALMAFAVYVQQITPGTIERPTSAWAWCMGLVGFALLFPVYTRFPRAWGRKNVLALRLVGIASAIGFVVYLNTGDGEAFSFAQHNIILLLLAHMSIVGSLVWLATRRHLWLRLATLLVVYLAHHKAMHGGITWLDPVVNLPGALLDLRWANGYLPWDIPAGLLDLSMLYNFTWYKFLFVVIPGTAIGDLLNRYMHGGAGEDDGSSWGVGRLLGFGVVMVGLILAVLVGLQCHGRVLFRIGSGVEIVTPWAVWLGVLPLLFIGLLLVRGARAPIERLIRSLYRWGALWLALGLCAEPFEGGIKKGPPATISYYLVALALSILLLAVFTIWIDALGRRRSLSLLVLNGQNPMLAYVGIRNLLAPLVMLPLLAPLVGTVPGINSNSINGWAVGLMGHSPWTLLIWSVAQTVLLAIIVAAFTRLRVVWRS